MGLGQASNIMAFASCSSSSQRGACWQSGITQIAPRHNSSKLTSLSPRDLTIGEDRVSSCTVLPSIRSSGAQVALPLDHRFKGFMGTYRQLTVDTPSVIDNGHIFKGEF